MSDTLRFKNLFMGSEQAHGLFQITGSPNHNGKVLGQARTAKGAITEDLVTRHLRGEIGLGSIPLRDDGLVSFGVIDIDDHHIDLIALEAMVRSMNLPLTVCRSKSGGAHLYLFLEKPSDPKAVVSFLHDAAAILGFPAAEIFPKQIKRNSADEVGNWINLPMFGVLK